MAKIEVVAVVGTCGPERTRYAERLAVVSGRALFHAQRLGQAQDPLQEAVDLLPWTDRAAGAVCEFPITTNPVELIGALAGGDAPIELTEVTCVADAMHLLSDLRRDQYFTRRYVAPEGVTTEHTAHALLTVMQLEYASTIVLVNWEALSTPELSTILSVVSHLSPCARLRLAHGPVDIPERGSAYTVSQERPGWVAILNGDYAPYMTDRRVSGFRYEQLKPFHPARLQHLLDDRIEPGEFGTVLRSAGMCRLVTRSHVVAEWQHVGRMLSLEPLALDAPEIDQFNEDGHEALALGQDLAFIGLDLDAAALTEALDVAVLTDDELRAGPKAWLDYPDPFPEWQGLVKHTE